LRLVGAGHVDALGAIRARVRFAAVNGHVLRLGHAAVRLSKEATLPSFSLGSGAIVLASHRR
jgi:hypothetical protein